jgi:endonuclease G
MKDFKAPREYWKLILRREQGDLRATVLIADQMPLIDYVPETRPSDAESKRVAFDLVEAYHESVVELERRTGLDFGDLVRAADTHAGAERRRVRTLEEVLASPKAERGTVASTAKPTRARRGG